eukprot:3821163-Amphidinium_carterae.1
MKLRRRAKHGQSEGHDSSHLKRTSIYLSYSASTRVTTLENPISHIFKHGDFAADATTPPAAHTTTMTTMTTMSL